MTIMSERTLFSCVEDKLAVLGAQETNDEGSVLTRSWSCHSAVHSFQGERPDCDLKRLKKSLDMIIVTSRSWN